MSALVVARSLGLVACLVVAMGATSVSAQNELQRGAPPSWVEVAAETAAPSAPSEDSIRMLLLDTQFRADVDRQSYYSRSRVQALSPQGLPVLGNVGVAWSPASQSVTVHHVDIIRDGQTIDVLASQSFETLRREANLEQSMLDGVLTALLQPSGLRIGDILDFAYTIESRDPVTAGHAEQAIELNLPVMVDQVRYRASWPTALPVRLRASNDWDPLRVRRDGDHSFVEVRRDAQQPVIVPNDVPGRFGAINRIELTDYRDWSDIAVSLKPLYDRARRLENDSPLKAQIERIRALSDDPAIQAAAALRLVQDEVRYVALLMGEGALTPATADETWTRRFGDCKAKTALLLALLDGLGIAAEPAAVSLLAGDGMDERLPMIGAFDHVLVRAVVTGEVRWLDGTRTGDRRLEDVAVPPFGWALPLTGPDAELEALVVEPKTVPDTDLMLAVDASAGLYAPASVEGTMIMRGEAASILGGQIGVIPAAQKDQGLRGIWSVQMNDLTIDEVGSTFDAENSVLTLTMKGTTTLDWADDGLIPPGSSFVSPSSAERAEGPFRSAPYAVNHPTFMRQATSLHLPGDGAGFRLSGGEVDRTELGHHARRSVRLANGVVTVQTEIRSLMNEVSAQHADEARAEAATRPYDPARVFAPANYETTEADRTAWIENAPTTAGEWLDRALALSRAGDAQGALEASDEAVALGPDDSATWANRGVYRFWLGDLEGAATDLDKAVDIDPSERVAMNGNALLAMSEKRYDDAVIEASRALRQAPKDDFALGLRAEAYLALEQYDRALRDADALIALQSDTVSMTLYRISILEQAGRADQAATEMDTLAESHPSDQVVLLNQAALKLERGEAQEASDILDGVLEADPENPMAALILRAEASIALDRLDLATRDFDTIRETDPPTAAWLNNLCWTAAKAGVLLDQALKDCDAALALAPDAANIIDSRARVLLQRGDTTSALEAYEDALTKNPELAASLYGRGLARIALGQTAEGEADKAAAIEIAPDVVDSFESYPATKQATTL